MKIDLTGQVVVVTGAGRGIGREICERVAEAGAVAVMLARSEAQLGEVAASIAAAGGRAVVEPCDVTDGEATKALVRRTIAALGRIDVLVNNAGVSHIGNLVMSKEALWRQSFEVNVFAAMRLTQQVVRPMIAARSGRIINVSSVAGKIGAAYASSYAAAKAAMLGFTKSVALETAKIGITCNAVCPWHVDTQHMREAMDVRAKLFGKSGEEYLAAIVEQSPQRRLITAREVAMQCLYLMSHEARGITGQAINVDGGMVMD